ncbi:hypothetical protein ACFLU6_04600 [Acidobacteriota bacterium]
MKRWLPFSIVIVIFTISHIDHCYCTEPELDIVTDQFILEMEENLKKRMASFKGESFESHDPFHEFDFESLAPQGRELTNAAIYYCNFMKLFDNNNVIDIALNDNKVKTYDVDKKEYKCLLNGLKSRECRFVEVEELKSPFWIANLNNLNKEDLGWGFCKEFNFEKFKIAAKSLIVQGKLSEREKKDGNSMYYYRLCIMLGRHFFESHEAIYTDIYGILLMDAGVNAIIEYAEKNKEIMYKYKEVYKLCKEFKKHKEKYFRQLILLGSGIIKRVNNASDKDEWCIEVFDIAEPALRHDYPSIRIEILILLLKAKYSEDKNVRSKVNEIYKKAREDSDKRVRNVAIWAESLEEEEVKKIFRK